MKLLFTKGALVRASAFIRRSARALVVGGPVGLFYALKLAYLRHRLAEVSVLMQRENELHRAYMAALCAELNGLIAAQQRTNQAAGEFWTHCGAEEKP